MTKLLIDSRRHRYVLKNSIAFVVKQAIPRRTKDARRAIVFRSRGGVAGRTVVDRELGVVDDHQIEPAVTIVIEERRTRAPARIISSTLLRHINKTSRTLVEIHLIRTEIRKIKVRQAIII